MSIKLIKIFLLIYLCSVTIAKIELSLDLSKESRVVINWKDSRQKERLYYLIEIFESSNDDALHSQKINHGQTELTYDKLIPGGDYRLEFEAKDIFEGKFKKIVKNLIAKPRPPQSLTQQHCGEYCIKVNWIEPKEPAIWDIYKAKINHSFWSSIQLLGSHSNTAVFYCLNPGQIYSISVETLVIKSNIE